jgi:putative intracellular protease/amidase
MSNRHRIFAASLVFVLGGAHAMAPERIAIKSPESSRAMSAGTPHAQLMRFLMQPVEDPNRLRGYRIAILAADGVDGFDLEVPRNFLAERGALVHVVVPRSAKDFQTAGSVPSVEPEVQNSEMQITMIDPSGEERTASFDQFLDQVQPCEYDLVYVPSNLAFSDRVAEQFSISFLQQAAAEGKPIFVMGNATLVLFKAGLIDNRTARADRATVSLVSPPTAADAAAAANNGVIHAGRDAFDMPVLMDELIAALRGRPAP